MASISGPQFSLSVEFINKSRLVAFKSVYILKSFYPCQINQIFHWEKAKWRYFHWEKASGDTSIGRRQVEIFSNLPDDYFIVYF